MATNADRMFFMNSGAESICASFSKELREKGVLSERGSATIDEFVREINKLIAKPDEKQVDEEKGS